MSWVSKLDKQTEACDLLDLGFLDSRFFFTFSRLCAPSRPGDFCASQRSLKYLSCHLTLKSIWEKNHYFHSEKTETEKLMRVACSTSHQWQTTRQVQCLGPWVSLAQQPAAPFCTCSLHLHHTEMASSGPKTIISFNHRTWTVVTDLTSSGEFSEFRGYTEFFRLLRGLKH